MSGKLTITAFTAILLVSLASGDLGQSIRQSVSGAEVTGTFRMPFTGKFKGSANEIRIAALGNGKLRVAFDLLYPYTMGNGEPMVNLGNADGAADIAGDTAVFSSNEGPCKIRIKFLRPGIIKVAQEGTDADCGFGANVTADGTYRKIGSKKPRF